jgi:trk system potassium uptake protein TrkH
MHGKAIIKQLGKILLFNSFFLFIAFFISLSLDEVSDKHLLISAIIPLGIGIFPAFMLPKVTDMKFVDGLFTVILGWVITCLVGMLPYVMWGHEFTLTNAWFESVSGFTTTGATILTDIESLPKGLLFWRSATHWIGGVGIVLFTILILPQSSSERMVLLNTEISELAKRNFKYRTRKILNILAVVYVGLTILETISLYLAGMSLFDAVNHSFSTIATGGFSTKNLSVATFNSLPIDIIIMIFMIFSGLHFGLIFNTITGKPLNIFTSSIAKAFLTVLALGVIFASLKLYFTGVYDNLGDAFRYGAFQVISVGTTTGFATADSANWPAFTQLIIIYFTIQCAMVGSTSGGLKFDRVYLFFRSLKKQFSLMRHPKAIIPLKVDGALVSESMEIKFKTFIITYLIIILIVTALLTGLDVDMMTAFSAAIATIGNVGPGFGDVSSLGNYNDIPMLGKHILTLNMLIGRWEIFSFISLFTFDYWKS